MRNARFIVLALLLLAVASAAACDRSRATTTHPSATYTQTTSSAAATTSATPSSRQTTQEAIEQTVSTMTLPAKAAQVLLVSFDGTTLTPAAEALLFNDPPGGVLLLGRNVTDAAQLRALTAALQNAATVAGAPGLLVAADEEGGPVMRVKDGVVAVPAARDLGDTSSPSHAQALAETAGGGLRGQGVNMVLAPVADVVANRDSFLFARSYGSRQEIVSGFVAAVTQGFEKRGLVTVVKHFPGHGSAPENSHTSVPVSGATRADFENLHLPPFEAAIAAGADGVMVGHFVVPAYDASHVASQSAPIIESLLREDLGFGGLVVSDDLEMAAAGGRAGAVGAASTAGLGEEAVAALAAGCDLLITTSTSVRRSAIEQAIVDAVRSGTLSEERLDQAVARILLIKVKHSIPVPGAGPQN